MGLKFQIKIAGDQSILVDFGDEIDEKLNRTAYLLAKLIDEHCSNNIYETILGYTTVLIHYDPLKMTYDQLEMKVKQFIKKIDITESKNETIVEIPVLYGSDFGPDLQGVAQHNNLTMDDVIQIHTRPIYDVYFLGFSPGFPFLGGMSDKIRTPRLANPRTHINAGSVGIANNQTGIYSVNSPGGWQIIGHTPLQLYEPQKDWPFLLSPGDQLKFKSITKEQYNEIVNQIHHK